MPAPFPVLQNWSVVQRLNVSRELADHLNDFANVILLICPEFTQASTLGRCSHGRNGFIVRLEDLLEDNDRDCTFVRKRCEVVSPDLVPARQSSEVNGQHLQLIVS